MIQHPNVFFTGKAGAGKSYCAKYLMDKYGYIPGKMAYPVYDIARNYFNMKSKDRYLLQLIGTDVGRTIIDEKLWINRFYEDIKIVEEVGKRLGKEVKLVADDVRFPNELKLLQELGWIGINLTVPEELRLKRLEGRDGTAQVETLNHISETALDGLTSELVTLDASGTLEQTYQRLEETLEFIRQEKLK